MHAAMTLAMGVAFLAWRPCRDRGAHAPRTAIAMLLLSMMMVWAGSLSLLVLTIAGTTTGLLAACGTVLSSFLSGGLGWWQTGLLVVWVMVFPLRGCWALSREHLSARRLVALARTREEPLTTAQEPTGASLTLVVDLGYPAVTVGVLRPRIVIDATFWSDADPEPREVVLAHEVAHRRGRHGLIQLVGQVLAAGLTPLPSASLALDCIRLHLEAMADDAAARHHGARRVGVTVGRVALASAPHPGLGVAGDAVWRTRRLLAPARTNAWPDVAVLGACVVMMSASLAISATAAAAAVPPLLEPNFCTI